MKRKLLAIKNALAAPKSTPGILAVLAVFSCIMLLPSLIVGVNETDSSGYNYIWAKQFSDLIHSGQYYPRWLPHSFGGLGSPVFIFYPPLAFFFDAAVNAATLDLLPGPYRLAVTGVLLLWLSGVAMYIWLVGTTRAPVAFWGSLAYIAAPYHLTDHYWRGAFAEFSLFAVLPLVLLGIKSAAHDWKGITGLALSFGLLIAAHIPTALLSSVTVLPIYAIYAAFCKQQPRLIASALLRCVVGAALGMGTVALYLIPALTLQKNVLSDHLWDPYFTPGRWLLINVMQWPSPQFMIMVGSFSLALAVLSVGVILLSRAGARPRGDAVVWASISLLCVGLMTGVIPQFWSIQIIAKVQFPWRIMAIAEFAAITALAIAFYQMTGRRLILLLVVASVAVLPGLGILAAHSALKILNARAYWAEYQPVYDAHMPDASEYLPFGFPKALIPNVAGPGPWDLPAAGSVACKPVALQCQATVNSNGAILVDLKSNTPTTVTVGQFYFPGWRAESADGVQIPLRPAPPYQFLQFIASPDVSEVRVYLGSTPAEEWGLVCSAASISILIVYWLYRRRI